MDSIVDPAGDRQTATRHFTGWTLRKAWADGYSDGVADERDHRDDPKYTTPNPFPATPDDIHEMRQGIQDVIERLTYTGEWEHDGGCEFDQPDCVACVVADLRAVIGVEQ